MTFEQAVNLFIGWGYRVEPGPEHEEVTLWIDGAGQRTCCVYPAHMLPEIAAVIQQVRALRKPRTIRVKRVDGYKWKRLASPLLQSPN